MAEGKTIREVLEKELEKRRFVTGQELTVDDLFEPEKLREWTEDLLGNDKMPELRKRIEAVEPERLQHAVATYLLGIAVREGLNLKFGSLPCIFSKGSYGDAFYFFWSVICLCHDLGYQYENGEYDLELMGTHDGRCQLFGIEYDLLQLCGKKLDIYGITPGGKEEKWIQEAVKLAENYSCIRRNEKEHIGWKPVIDHGIAGALILYDALMKEYEKSVNETDKAARGNRYRDQELNADQQIPIGELSTNLSNARFAACSILIACTVARHNMWNAEDKETKEKYQGFGLDLLCQGNPGAVIHAEKPLDQMLFLLDFMDTIDPVKGIYTRAIETKETGHIEDRKDMLLNRIKIRFWKADLEKYRWESALSYRKITISKEKIAEEKTPEQKRWDEKNRNGQDIFTEDYVRGIRKMSDWLETKPPYVGEKEGKAFSVTCYYPSLPSKPRIWAGGITENEIAALCLYEGSGGNGKAEPFYQYHNAYQTFNLLMMGELEGEQVRVCAERQNPNGLYITEWKRTLEIMTEIFTAQCKYMECRRGKRKRVSFVHRVDRKVNFDMMVKHGGTFAFTSTSKAGYLKNISESKKDLILLDLILTEEVPFVDYAGLLKKAYAYSDEQEVLLPPFLELKGRPMETELSDEEKKVATDKQQNTLRKYVVVLGGFQACKGEEDEAELISKLDENKKKAANFLDQIREERVIPDNGDAGIYLEWKTDFQALVKHCLYNIGAGYGLKK